MGFSPTLLSALGHRRLRAFWWTEALTYLAQQAWQTALLWALGRLGQGPLWVALGVASLNIPALVVGVIGPERVRAGRPLAALPAAGALAVAAPAALWAGGRPGAALLGGVLVAASLVLGVANAAQVPLLQADLADSVDAPSLAAANAGMEFTSRLGLLAGPILAGLALGRLHLPFTLGSIAIAMLAAASAVSLWERGAAGGRTVRRQVAPGAFAGLARSWPHVRRDGFLTVAIAVRGVNNLVWPAVTLGLPLLTVARWHGGALGYGLVVAVRAVGSVAGTAIAARLDERRLAAAYFAAWAGEGLAFIVLAFTPVLWGALVLSAFGGIVGPLVHVALDSHIGRTVAPADRGSVFALQRLVISAAGLAGSLVVGGIVSAAGADGGANAVATAVLCAGGVVFLTAVVGYAAGRRRGVLAPARPAAVSARAGGAGRTP